MGYDNADVYYQPEKFDLSIVDELDERDLSYEFNMFVVWKHTDGRLFYGIDSGCSCPSPFEDYHSLDDLTEIKTYDQLKEAVEGWNEGYCRTCVDDHEIVALLQSVGKLIPRG